MRPFGPFVPRVHEHQTLAAFEACARIHHGIVQPFTIPVRTRLQEYDAISRTPGLAIPRGTNAAEQFVPWSRIPPATLHERGQVIHLAGKIRVIRIDPVVEYRWGRKIRGELSRCVESIH